MAGAEVVHNAAATQYKRAADEGARGAKYADLCDADIGDRTASPADRDMVKDPCRAAAKYRDSAAAARHRGDQLSGRSDPELPKFSLAVADLALPADLAANVVVNAAAALSEQLAGGPKNAFGAVVVTVDQLFSTPQPIK